MPRFLETGPKIYDKNKITASKKWAKILTSNSGIAII